MIDNIKKIFFKKQNQRKLNVILTDSTKSLPGSIGCPQFCTFAESRKSEIMSTLFPAISSYIKWINY